MFLDSGPFNQGPSNQGPIGDVGSVRGFSPILNERSKAGLVNSLFDPTGLWLVTAPYGEPAQQFQIATPQAIIITRCLIVICP
jgi:hypothetical protein